MNRYVINGAVDSTGWGDLPTRNALEFHRRMPGYRRTPLHRLDRLADQLEAGRVWLKDESERLELPAFKVLGASWAVYRLISELLGHEPEGWGTVDDLREVAAPLKPLRLVTATDGNHGRGVARVAKWLGFEAEVFMPRGSVEARIRAIEGEGARVTIVDGPYDEAVRHAAGLQGERTYLMQDNSWPGYEKIPAWIIEGYSTLMREIEESLAENGAQAPKLVIVPIGNGSLAVAVVAHWRRQGLESPPKILGVEPVSAACALASLEAGESVDVSGESGTIMAGLNCGTLASLAWPVIRRGIDACLAIEDEWSRKAVSQLMRYGVASGESGAAATAALIALVQDRDLAGLREELEVNKNSRVLVFSTEGITDPVSYAEIVGQTGMNFRGLKP